MSAWLVSTKHINALVEGAIRLGLVEQADATKTARMLRRANRKSIAARYGDYDYGLVEARENDSKWGPYFYRAPAEPVSEVTLFKLAACYDYQTCEFDSYERSVARRFVERLESKLESYGINRESPGYDEAPWGI